MATKLHYKNKRGISGVIVTLLLVALSIVLIAVVWTVVNNLVNEKIKNTSSCFGNFDKITLNQQYTCYNSTSPQFVQFSLKRGDLDLDSVTVSINGEGGSETFTITNESSSIAHLKSYGPSSSYGDSVALPSKNSGSTYVYEWTASYSPVSVEIAPTIDGTKCSPADTIPQISDCRLVA